MQFQDLASCGFRIVSNTLVSFMLCSVQMCRTQTLSSERCYRVSEGEGCWCWCQPSKYCCSIVIEILALMVPVFTI